MGDVYVSGVGMTDIGWHSKDPHELGVWASVRALDDAGLHPSDIGGVISTPHGYMADTRRFPGQRIADYLGIAAELMLDVESGGNSSTAGIRVAYEAIKAGKIGSCLVFAAQREASKKRILEDVISHLHLIVAANSLYDTYQAAYGVISPLPFYAMAVQRYMYRYDLEPMDVARVAVILREHARMNPSAAYKEPLTVEEVLASPLVSPPIHRLESSEMCDGAAAIVLVAEDLARKVGRAIRIAAIAEAHDATSFLPYQGEIDRFPCVGRAAAAALEESGYGISDIDVAEVYGAFAGVELMVYEELGFFEPGEAPRAVKEGKTTHGGEVLLNPSGGRLSLGHPAYVTPLLEVNEVVTQLRGLAGERQRPGASVGMVHTEQGFINGSIVMILDHDNYRG